ncbi:MAG: hypothetical protein U9R16_08295, partial [Campylobacterota bacterium]|nr:hypothetical protein [Campylobacterota bacterium]
MKNKKIVLFILISLFIVTNIVLYILIEKNSKQQIKLVLDSHTSKLETNFKILLHHLKITSDSAYKSTTNKKFLIDILSRIDENTTNQEKKILRDKLYKKLKDKYEILKSKGVFQYHFVLPNNESFLRMHKVKKFGDDLSNIRLDFKYVNDTKKPISGFTQGKTSHGFRFIYLIFSDTKYLGAMEVSFSSEILQEYLTNIVDLHTHFLVNKEIINVTQWERDDIKLEYLKSSEHKDFMITMTKNHTKKECVTDNKLKLKPIIKEIENRVKENKMFSLYTKNDNKIIVVSFYPVKNIYNKTVAWLVSYENSEYIKNIYTKDFFNKTIGLFIILFIFYFLYMILNQKYLLEKLVNEKTNSLSKLNRELEESEYEVTLINENLEEKIKEEISKSKKIQNELFKSERLASMGEMIGNIAHQWRQPLSVISTAASGIKLQKEFGSLTDDFLLNSCDIINDSTQYLSQTIEDFRHFTKD